MGYERRFNPAFLYDQREDFIAFMTHGQPTRPANMENIVAINQGRRPFSLRLPEPDPMPSGEVAELLDDGQAVLLDIRDIEEFGRGHPAGALNIQLSSSQFEQRVGWVVPADSRIILAAESEESVRAALQKLAFIGLETRIVGYLQGGVNAWKAAGLSWVDVPQWTVEEVHRRLQDRPLQVMDVREQDEWDEGHIEGALHLSYRQLIDELDGLDLDPDSPVVLACASGYRSSTAASILQAAGYREVVNMEGGMDAWKQAGLPIV